MDPKSNAIDSRNGTTRVPAEEFLSSLWANKEITRGEWIGRELS